ncbi:hypothetical protein A2215_04355 [Candidatus Berkelbacteria bacterium RIFOXYA2_FULL_43_10]|uniref:ZIP family metal transporter n=1 Tax=Candidatus Berkelbacteria bacterium RIFOXYA2_FULL_43_10 TaxID=1797472 RepID=A0A1F5EAP5_9BACT|nr:MAG: hypothetical protein A2215_04355 [Candidatus Berkelbacteria bacterium RIFOXYA2_FULL_43_10]
MVWLYSLTAVLIVSLLSFSGALVLFLKKDALKNILLILVAFSTGALLGDAFIHLIPEAVRDKGELNAQISILIFAGILLFFILEKFLRWRHCHDIDCEVHPKHLGLMNLVGDSVHNFIDGVLIAASFMVSIPLGVATTIAVIAHEVPQELGDFGVLLHSGFSKGKAILFNFYTALTAVAGALLTLLLGGKLENLATYIVPLTAGGFIYIALSGLVPELHKEQGVRRSFVQLLAIIAGLGVMYILLFIE